MEQGTVRLETFSDGVFAIAATLLVLEFSVRSGRNLGHQLVHLWPAYLAYAATLVVMAILHQIWWQYARRNRRLISDGAPDSALRAVDRAYAPGIVLYGIVLVLAFFSPLAAVFITFAIAAFYLPSAALFDR